MSSIAPGESAVVFSDSAYVANCFRNSWHVKWERNGWRTSGKKPVKNPDLWRELLPLVLQRDITFTHVKGHDGNYRNELADERAVRAALGRSYVESVENPDGD